MSHPLYQSLSLIPPSASFRRDWHTHHLAEIVSAEDRPVRSTPRGWPRGNLWLAVGQQSCLRLLQGSGCKALATGLLAGCSSSLRGLSGGGGEGARGEVELVGFAGTDVVPRIGVEGSRGRQEKCQRWQRQLRLCHKGKRTHRGGGGHGSVVWQEFGFGARKNRETL
jgi:hypothetical protein